MSGENRVAEAILPVIGNLGLSLYDLEVGGGVVRVTITRPDGIDTEVLTSATRAISRALDDADPLAGSYTLEVSSPGLERNLRTPEHFAGAAGEQVKIKTRPGSGSEDAERRFEGRVLRVDGDDIVVDTATGEVAVPIAEVERARTVFEWGPAPKPGGGGKSAKQAKGKRN